MRKVRIISLLMAVVMLAALSGCEKKYTTVKIAYVSSKTTNNPDSSAIVYEERKVANVDKDRLYRLALQLSAEEPGDKDLYTVLPENIKINTVEIKNGSAEVDVDESIKDLEGIERTLGIYCLAMTVFAFGEAESVTITVDGIAEASILREEDIVNSRDKLRLVDYNIKLYFPDEDKDKCTGIDATIRVSKASDPVIEAVRMLIRGEGDIKLVSKDSKTPILLSVNVKKRICYINFSEDFVNGCVYNRKGVNLTVYSIVNTLTQFTNIDKVKILVAGADAGTRLGLGTDEAVYPNLALTM